MVHQYNTNFHFLRLNIVGRKTLARWILQPAMIICCPVLFRSFRTTSHTRSSPASLHWLIRNSLVSRSWRTLFRLHSSLLFCIRSPLNLSKHFPIISVVSSYSNPGRYFIFHLDFPHFLSPLPPPPFPTILSASFSIGPEFFLLGGSIDGIPTSKVQIFDCRVKRWSLGPEMGAARRFASAGVVDGRIYVDGGCYPLSPSWAEVLDWGDGRGIKKWKSLRATVDAESLDIVEPPMVERDRKIVIVTEMGGMVFDSFSEKWTSVYASVNRWWGRNAAVVNGIIYRYNYKSGIHAYDLENDMWRKLEGFEYEISLSWFGEKLADIDGRLFLVYEVREREEERSLNLMKIVFLEIGVKDNDESLSGFGVGSTPFDLQLPSGSSIEHCVAVQL